MNFTEQGFSPFNSLRENLFEEERISQVCFN